MPKLIKDFAEKLNKIWKKLLRAEALGKEKKAAKLEHKLLRTQLEAKKIEKV